MNRKIDKIEITEKDKHLEKIEEFIAEHAEEAEQIADDVARAMTDNKMDASELGESIAQGMKSNNGLMQEKMQKIGGEFAAKLAGQLFDQIIYTNYADDRLVGWYTKFPMRKVEWGARVGFVDNISTGCKLYKLDEYLPSEFTNSLLDTFEASFFKPGTNNVDSATTYRFKKNKSITLPNWTFYFINGKVSNIAAAILADLAKGFSLFITYRFQKIIANLADGTAQKPSSQAGENGNALKLKKYDGTGANTYEALIEFNEHIINLTQDFNKESIGTDSRSIFTPSYDDLIIFIPKKLRAIVENGILSRAPNANAITFTKYLNGENVITTTKQLKDMQWTSDADDKTQKGNEAPIQIETYPFLPDDTIVVLERRAIHHFVYVREGGESNFPENLVHEYVQHAWGFTAILPFAKGFVYKNPNLLNYKI